VVSAWKHDGRLDLVLDIDGEGIESLFGREFVRRGLCRDLSLGYNVEMSRSPAGFLRASNKRVVEVSLVKVGARENCHIRGWGEASERAPQAGPSGPVINPGRGMHVILP
jgi:hypothetical protein